jgi:hypothetical protein
MSNTFTEFPDLTPLVTIAVEEYQAQTSILLANHPLASELEKCESVMSVTRVLQGQLKAFRGSHGKVVKPLKRIVHILHALSSCAVLGKVIGLVIVTSKGLIFWYLTLLFCSHARLRKRSLQPPVSSSSYVSSYIPMRVSM